MLFPKFAASGEPIYTLNTAIRYCSKLGKEIQEVIKYA